MQVGKSVLEIIEKETKGIEKFSKNEFNEMERNALLCWIREERMRKSLFKHLISNILFDTSMVNLLEKEKGGAFYFEPNFHFLEHGFESGKVMIKKGDKERKIIIGKGNKEVYERIDEELAKKENKEIKKLVNIYTIGNEEDAGETIFVVDEKKVKYLDTKLLENILKGYVDFLLDYVRVYLITFEGKERLYEYYLTLFKRTYQTEGIKKHYLYPVLTVYDENYGIVKSFVNDLNSIYLPYSNEINLRFGIGYKGGEGSMSVDLYFLYEKDFISHKRETRVGLKISIENDLENNFNIESKMIEVKSYS